MTEEELYHYGVKGMRWGVRRDLSERAEKHAAKVSNKTEKWASKKIQKGKGEKALAKLERKQSRGVSENAINGMKRRTEAFDALVEKKMAKDPSYANLGPKEKQYLESKVASQLLVQEYGKMQLKKSLIKKATDEAVKKYGAEDLRTATRSEATNTVGIKVVSFIISSKMTKSNVTAIKEIVELNATESRQRRTEELRKQLNR